jgi:hypothetical protein
MSQQIKKKFLSPEIIDYFEDQIDAAAQSVSQEVIDRQDGDAALDAKLDQEVIDRELGDQNLQDQIDSISPKIEELELAVEALEQSGDVFEFGSEESFPSEGESSKIYVAKDSNKIYRYEESEGGGSLDLPEMPSAPQLTVTTSITSADDLQATINAASDGDVIFLADGTYSLAANLSISKQIALVGESQAGVLIQDTRGNSQSFVSVSVDNVTLKDLTVRHSTTESSIGHAITVSGAGFPQARLNNFRMYNVKSQYSKGGLSVRSDNFVVEGCTFEVVAGSSTRRGILHYGNGGDSFIKNTHFINATTGALRAITPTGTSGTNPSDDQAGSLTIEGSTFSGNLSQFVNMDNHQGAAGAFELIIKDNVTPETNAFVVSFGGSQNFGDLFSRIVIVGNTLTNNHAAGLGKGALALDGVNGPLSYRTSALPVISSGNTLGQLAFRSGYAEAVGSSGSIVGYSTAISEPTVEMSEGSSGGSGSYIELSPDIEQDLSNLQSQIDAEKSRIDAILDASDADKDSFAEIVALINSVDTENDQAFAGYVSSNDAALAQEVSDRQAGDAATLVSANEYTDSQIAAIPEVDLTSVEGRLDALEAKTDGPNFNNGSVVVGTELSYIDLDREYIKLMSVAVGRLAVHEGEDFTVSVVEGKTRLTWIGSLVNPGGVEAIEEGDKVFFVGAY